VHKRTWKKFESAVAALLYDGERIPVLGRNRDTNAPDVTSRGFAVQVKKGRKQPGYLREWLDGIRSKCGDKLPAAVWGANGKGIRDAVVVLDVDTFQVLAHHYELNVLGEEK